MDARKHDVIEKNSNFAVVGDLMLLRGSSLVDIRVSKSGLFDENSTR